MKNTGTSVAEPEPVEPNFVWIRNRSFPAPRPRFLVYKFFFFFFSPAYSIPTEKLWLLIATAGFVKTRLFFKFRPERVSVGVGSTCCVILPHAVKEGKVSRHKYTWHRQVLCDNCPTRHRHVSIDTSGLLACL